MRECRKRIDGRRRSDGKRNEGNDEDGETMKQCATSDGCLCRSERTRAAHGSTAPHQQDEKHLEI